MSPSRFGVMAVVAACALVGCRSVGKNLGVSAARPSANFPTPWGAVVSPTPKKEAVAVKVAPAVATPPALKVETAAAPRPREATPKASGLVAVLPLNYTQADIDKATQLTLEEAIRNTAGDALAAHGYTILTGETTLAVLADNNISAEQACEANCALSAARELKAKLFLSGTVTRSEGELIAFIRLFDSETGRQLASVHLEGETVKSLRQAFEQKAEGLVKKGLERL